jgi:cell pole-organizing protein PopZ
MTQPAKSQEPSMEEILASIRRIIADDDASKSVSRQPEPAKAAPPAPPPEPSPVAAEVPSPPAAVPDVAAEPASDILELTESMQAAPPAPEPMPSSAPQFRTIDGSFDVSYEEVAEPSAPQGNEAPARLISHQTSAAVDSAFNTLAQTVLVKNARTLEDLVREMLRPMLKSWLDDNLPGLVERLVRAEIDRVSRGRTS